MFPSPKTTATLSLLSLAGLSSAARSCSDVKGICLTSFRWCDSSPCEYPEGIFPVSGDLDGNVGYAVITAGTTYNLTWTNVAAGAEVMVQWSVPTNNDYPLNRVKWSRNTTDGYFVFSPRRVWDEIIKSGDHDNVTMTDLVASSSQMNSVLHVRDLSEPNEDLQATDMSSTFAVQNGWTAKIAPAQEQITLSRERRKWRLGVGIGVGLGVPIIMVITALVTWFVMKKKARKHESLGVAKERASASS